jgi:hypothetical protein
MALLERLVHERYSLSPVPMEIAFGSLELPLGFFQMTDGRLDPRVMLGRRSGRGYAGSRWR